MVRFIVFAALLLWNGVAFAQSPDPERGPAELYFLAVGAADYTDPDFNPPVPSHQSAEVVARALMDAGAKYGILLTSSPKADGTVTRDSFHAALTRLKKRIRTDRAKAPRVIVYIMTHGAADPASNYLFMAPDNLVIEEPLVKQDHVFRLARRSIWNFDVLTALMNFRMDERLSHFDNFVYSSLMSDRLGLAMIAEQGAKLLRFKQDLDQKAAGYGPKPFNNAPIPFVVLFDNCTNGFEANLVEPNPLLDLFTRQVNSATLDGGRAFYAVPPGEMAAPMELPEALASPGDRVEIRGRSVRPNVGPLAIHLKNVLSMSGNGGAMTVDEFASAFRSSGADDPDNVLPDAPYEAREALRPGVAAAEFIPARSSARGEVERIGASMADPVSCCQRID